MLTLQRVSTLLRTNRGEVPIVSSSVFRASTTNEKWAGIVIGRKARSHCPLPSQILASYTTLWSKTSKNTHISPILQTLKLENFDAGASNPTLNRNHLHKIKIMFPKTVEIQKRIGAILSAYDYLVEKNKQSIVLLDTLAEEIYREWFIRFRFTGGEKVRVCKRVPQGWSRSVCQKLRKSPTGSLSTVHDSTLRGLVDPSFAFKTFRSLRRLTSPIRMRMINISYGAEIYLSEWTANFISITGMVTMHTSCNESVG